MAHYSKSKEEFLSDLHKEFPALEGIHVWELNKVKFKLLDQSFIGKMFQIIYFLVAIASLFIYWKLLSILERKHLMSF